MEQRMGRPNWIPWAAGVAIAALFAVGAIYGDFDRGGGGRHFFFFPWGFFLIFWLFFFARGCGGWGYRRGFRSREEDGAAWDEWHRRAHERMKTPPGQGAQ